MIIFNWKFNLQKTLPYDIESQNVNVIKTLGWHLECYDSEFSNKKTSSAGSIDFDISDLSGFKSIEEVTKEDLQSWVENRIGIEKIDSMKNNMEQMINLLPDDHNQIPNI
jgi:hypothetical protein